MNILVTGASGFIASQMVTDLLAAGHAVTCCVRNVIYTQKLFPTAKIIPCDFVHDNTPSLWATRLNDIDLVINCVGILYHPNKKVIWNVHYHSPKALFDACVLVGIKKVIQISALGIERSPIAYAVSKKAADDYLLTLALNAIIVRPSLVYGRGSYGGTSLFRGLAGIPWITPLPGKGQQEFQPIHNEDLSKAIIKLIEQPPQQNVIFSAVSTKKTNLATILTTLRDWLGFAKAKLISMPLGLIRIGAFLGDMIPYSVLNTNSYKLLMEHNVTSPEETKKFHDAIGFVPREFSPGVYSHPSAVQDRYQARLYFLKPILKFSIAFIWLFTALCCLFIYPKSASYSLLAQIGINEFWQPVLFYAASLLDAGIGMALLLNIQVKKVGLLQLIIIMLYSGLLTWRLPSLWFEPFAPLAKNIPLLAAILVSMALEDER